MSSPLPPAAAATAPVEKDAHAVALVTCRDGLGPNASGTGEQGQGKRYRRNAAESLTVDQVVLA
jgi:hypothetical protein